VQKCDVFNLPFHFLTNTLWSGTQGIVLVWNSQMAPSLFQIRVLCSTLTMSSFPLYRPWKSTVAANLRSKNSLMVPSLASHRSAHFLGLFSLPVESHWDREIEWGGLLSPKHAVLPLHLITHLLCILQRFWFTLSHVRMYSSQKRNNVSPLMMSQANSPHSSWFLGHGRKRGPILRPLKIHRELTKMLQHWVNR